MRKIKLNYLKILTLEIEDFKTDLEVLIQECRKAKEQGRYTNYVFLENLTVFNNELLGVDVFNKIIQSTKPDNYRTLDEMIDDLKHRFRRKVRDRGLVEAINIYVDRKMEKVKRYVVQ